MLRGTGWPLLDPARAGSALRRCGQQALPTSSVGLGPVALCRISEVSPEMRSASPSLLAHSPGQCKLFRDPSDMPSGPRQAWRTKPSGSGTSATSRKLAVLGGDFRTWVLRPLLTEFPATHKVTSRSTFWGRHLPGDRAVAPFQAVTRNKGL